MTQLVTSQTHCNHFNHCCEASLSGMNIKKQRIMRKSFGLEGKLEGKCSSQIRCLVVREWFYICILCGLFSVSHWYCNCIRRVWNKGVSTVFLNRYLTVSYVFNTKILFKGFVEVISPILYACVVQLFPCMIKQINCVFTVVSDECLGGYYLHEPKISWAREK
jgi:hypothetical protein